MIRRRLSVALGLFCGVALLVWGMVSLQRVFALENEATRTALEGRAEALQQYGSVALERRLAAVLAKAQPRIDMADQDPLAPNDDLLLVVAGEQRLPRRAIYVDGDSGSARSLYEQLTRDVRTTTEEAPWAERLTLLTELKHAVRRKNAQAITVSVRAWLNHRARHVLLAERELVHTLRMLEVFVHGTTPEPSLLRSLLRDGLRGSRGGRIQGLQPMLIAQRHRFTKADFDFLLSKVTALCVAARVPHDALQAAANRAPQAPVAVPAKLTHPALLNGQWYVEPFDGNSLRGVAVSIEAALGEIVAEMRQGGLLDPSGTLAFDRRFGPVERVSLLPLRAASDSWQRERTRIERRYAIKTALNIALGGLAVVIVLLVVLSFRRQQRFLQAKADFVASVSHELRTPLASLRLMGETLQRRLKGTEAGRDFPHRIVTEADRLAFLVENILSFNRLDKGGFALQPETLGLEEVMERLQRDAAVFTKKRVCIAFDGDANTALEADRDLIKLVFSNLLSNACKYNDKSTVEVIVSAECNGDVVVRFVDNGHGIAKEEQEKVFSEFFRASQSSKRAGGFGLGLAICRRIMRLHRGSIRIAKSDAAGTTFVLRFPISRQREP